MTHETRPRVTGDEPAEDGWLPDAADADLEIQPGEPVPWPEDDGT